MVSKRERCTITTLIDGEEVEMKTSKILVHRCDECNGIITNYDAEIVDAHCRICGMELCKKHRIPAPYIDINSWEPNVRNICSSCNKTYANELKNLELANEAVHSATLTHLACGDAISEAQNTIDRKFIKNQCKMEQDEDLTFVEVQG